MARKHSPQYPKSASDQPLQQLLFWIYCRWLEIIFPSPPSRRCRSDRTFKFILFYFPILRLIGVKACILKPQTFALCTPSKEHAESAICKDHLAPCRLKCWTNQISIGNISQPLSVLKSHFARTCRFVLNSCIVFCERRFVRTFDLQKGFSNYKV